MAKIHFQGIPCNSKSWSERLEGAIVYKKDGNGNLIPDDVCVIPESLPETDNWLLVTCKKCLRVSLAK